MNRKTGFIIVVVIGIVALGLFWTIPARNPITGGINPKSFGAMCEFSAECNGIVGINCRAEVDGPYYYIDKKTGATLGYCGGYCMNPGGEYCKPDTCPPPAWTCGR